MPTRITMLRGRNVWQHLGACAALALTALAACCPRASSHPATEPSPTITPATTAGADETTTQPADDPFKDWYDSQWKAWLKPPPPDQPQPSIVCKQSTVDVGTIWRGTRPKIAFEVSNEGQAPLRIRVRSH